MPLRNSASLQLPNLKPFEFQVLNDSLSADHLCRREYYERAVY